LIKIFSLFKKKPKKTIVNGLERLDKKSEDSYALDVAILKVMALAKEYGPPGMVEMAKEISRQVGENILQSGLKKWSVNSPPDPEEIKKYISGIVSEIDIDDARKWLKEKL